MHAEVLARKSLKRYLHRNLDVLEGLLREDGASNLEHAAQDVHRGGRRHGGLVAVCCHPLRYGHRIQASLLRLPSAYVRGGRRADSAGSAREQSAALCPNKIVTHHDVTDVTTSLTRQST